MSFTAVLKADSEPNLQSGLETGNSHEAPERLSFWIVQAVAGAQMSLVGSAHSSDCHVCSIVGHAGVSLYARREAQRAP